MNNTVWVLVANASSARILKPENKHDLVELESFEHPEARLHGRDLVSDRPGRTDNSNTHGHHSLNSTTQPKKVEAQHFADHLSQHLDHAHKSGSFHRLYLIVSPAFLGLIRGSLHSNTQNAIALAIDKDVTEKSNQEIRSYLPLAL